MLGDDLELVSELALHLGSGPELDYDLSVDAQGNLNMEKHTGPI